MRASQARQGLSAFVTASRTCLRLGIKKAASLKAAATSANSRPTGRLDGCLAGHFARNFLLRGCGAETRFRVPQPEARFVVFVYALGTRGGTICGVATRKNRNRLLVQASQQNPRSRRNLQR